MLEKEGLTGKRKVNSICNLIAIIFVVISRTRTYADPVFMAYVSRPLFGWHLIDGLMENKFSYQVKNDVESLDSVEGNRCFEA